jgi:hypothetical protein
MQGDIMPRFDIGVVFSRFFQLIGQNFGLFAVIGFIGIVLPGIAATIVGQMIIGAPTVWTEAFQRFDGTAIAGLGGIGLVALVINLMTVSAITETAILRAVGKKVETGALLGSALRNVIPLFVISLLVVIFVALGCIALIIPGIFLALCLWMAIPAYVGQPGLGIWGAVMKSFELTRGNRWWLLLIAIILFFASMMINGTIGVALIGFAMSSGDVHQVTSLPVQIANAVVGGITRLLGYIFAAATYVTLRESKEKLSPDNAAEVFS